MKITLFAVAAVAFGLAACQPATDETEATAADTAASDATTLAPADPAAGAMSPAPTAPMTGSTPPADPSGGMSGTMNPDGSMSNGAVNPASPPPVTSPDTMGSPPRP